MDISNVSSKVFSLLKGHGLKIKIFDEAGSETVDPSLGRRYFVSRPNLMLNIDDNVGIEFIKGAGVKNELDSLQRSVKSLADKNLMNFSVKMLGKSIQPKDYSYQAKISQETTMNENQIKPVNSMLLGHVMKAITKSDGITTNEIAANVAYDPTEVQRVINKLVKDGKVTTSGVTPDGQHLYMKSMEEAVFEDLKEGFSRMYGSTKTSRQVIENVSLVIKHKKPVKDESRGSRARQIGAIFIECNGERLRFPSNNLQGARAMAHHISHGGSMGDSVGQYINDAVETVSSLRKFESYAKTNKLVNESTSEVMSVVESGIASLRGDLTNLCSPKGYHQVSERIKSTESTHILEQDVTSLRDMFTVRYFSEEVASALPKINTLVLERQALIKRLEEAASKTIMVTPGRSATSIMEFTSENAELGYRINELASRIIGNEELASHVKTIGTNVAKGKTLSDFDKSLFTNVLEHVTINAVESTGTTEIKEARDFETFLEGFDIKFI